MNNFNLTKYLKNNPLLQENQDSYFVYKITNNASESENLGKSYVGIMNYRFPTTQKALLMLKSKVNDKTTGGGAKALAFDLAEYGVDEFSVEVLGNGVPGEEAKVIKKMALDDISSKDYYNKSSLDNIGPRSQEKFKSLGNNIEKRGEKYNISRLDSSRVYILVKGEWFDLPKAFEVSKGDPTKWGPAEEVLSYEDFITQHPNAKAKGY